MGVRDWIPERRDWVTSLVTSITTSLLVSVFVYLLATFFLTTGFGPTTEHEISLVSAYPSAEDEYVLVVGNTGGFREENVTVTVSSLPQYRETRTIPALVAGEDATLRFQLPASTTRSFARHEATQYTIRNGSLAERLCGPNVTALPPFNSAIHVTEIRASGRSTVPRTFRIEINYRNSSEPALRTTVVHPQEYAVAQDQEYRVVGANLTERNGSCYVDDIPLFWIQRGDGVYVEESPAG